MKSTPLRIPDGQAPRPERPFAVRLIRKLFGVIIPVAVLVGGIAVAVYFVRTAPKAEQKALVREAQLADVTTVRRGDHRVVVKAMGTVIPSKRITLQPQVSGELIEVSKKFVPGGRFDKGETIVKIDHEDYDLIVKQRAANVVKAKHDLKIEQGQQTIAKREFELIGKTNSGGSIDSDLILRKPQLELAIASVDSAQAALDKAKLQCSSSPLREFCGLIILGTHESSGLRLLPALRYEAGVLY